MKGKVSAFPFSVYSVNRFRKQEKSECIPEKRRSDIALYLTKNFNIIISFHSVAPVRLPVPDRDGVRYGSLAPLIYPQAYLEKRRVGLQAIDRPRVSLGGLP